MVLERDDAHDRSETVECYAHGKTWVCACGESTWGYLDTKMKKCIHCGDILVDPKYNDREPPQTDDGQMTLGAF